MNPTPPAVHYFREAAPYLDDLRGKTLVIGIASPLLSGNTLRSLAGDIKWLASLGVRVVIAYGSFTQLNDLAAENNITLTQHQGKHIADETVLRLAKFAVGQLHSDLLAALSSGLAGSLQRGKRLAVRSGNYVSAKSCGVLNGVDMMYTGSVRKVDSTAIRQDLDAAGCVLIAPLASALSGQVFHLSMPDLAQACALALQAEKLIFVLEEDGICTADGNLLTNLSAREAREHLQQNSISNTQNAVLQAAVEAVENGVARCQIISGKTDGALLSELFTRDGTGTSIARNAFVSIRAAEYSDIADIINLTRPLEEKGVLLPRSRQYFEQHIHEFFVLEHDRHIYGCVALKLFAAEQVAELACLVVSPKAQDGGYGELLLAHLQQISRERGAKRLIALTTHTSDWFRERGFSEAELEVLPSARLTSYLASQRQSKIFQLDLSQ
ncbi:MAG: amino-acid N-acetyltransferase [Neisseria sp.]|nr:amino-acid N-acetyltransferase [Neisseria sp.]